MVAECSCANVKFAWLLVDTLYDKAGRGLPLTPQCRPPTYTPRKPSIRPRWPIPHWQRGENNTASHLSISLCVSLSIWGSRAVHSCTHESHESVQTCIVFEVCLLNMRGGKVFTFWIPVEVKNTLVRGWLHCGRVQNCIQMKKKNDRFVDHFAKNENIVTE